MRNTDSLNYVGNDRISDHSWVTMLLRKCITLDGYYSLTMLCNIHKVAVPLPHIRIKTGLLSMMGSLAPQTAT